MIAPWLEEVVSDAAARMAALPWHHPARAYLRERGVRDEWIASYRLGWMPSPEARHATPEFWAWLLKTGWDKIVFPMTDAQGQVIGVQLRSAADKRYGDFLLQPRDLYMPSFGAHVALPAAWSSQRLILVEGVFDYFAVRAYAPDVIALMTATASASMRRLVARYATSVVSLLDMDGPGRRASYKLAGLPCPPEWQRPEDKTAKVPPTPPYLVTIPAYTEHDPDDLRKVGKVEELQRLTSYGLSPGSRRTA